ncbi:ABC transporter ATP-binding protein [Lachnoclostridium sp. An181]|uniref:ABC transporter ATP-binding protein n=1 Tax=Lachnoclostridium sp. An181 TaxID=1965575 RepID=UPI000B36A4A4|nr:ABC transporter ATP-binding protein [Lachnoclostridium sp. An181]OUP50683.1 ABC transporter ATP-binding protein [Lachnoclostridium sp. An181]
MELVIEHLEKHFEKKQVLKDVSYRFEEGKIYALLGRNGAGKTTLFNCLNRDMKNDGGEFYIVEGNEQRKTKTEDIGYVLSTPTVPEFLTGREFLKFFIDINREHIEDLKSIDEYFEMMNIEEEDRDKLLNGYSHGMKNKMQMLINVIAKPKILLLDEPLTSLDVVAAEEMQRMLKSWKKEQIIIFSTHIMELALSLCDEIVILNGGKLFQVERGEEVAEEFRQKIIKLLQEDGHVSDI